MNLREFLEQKINISNDKLPESIELIKKYLANTTDEVGFNSEKKKFSITNSDFGYKDEYLFDEKEARENLWEEIIELHYVTPYKFKEDKNEMDKLEKYLNIPDLSKYLDKDFSDYKVIEEFYNEIENASDLKLNNLRSEIETEQLNYIKDNLQILKKTPLYDNFLDEVESQKPENPDEAIKWMEENEPYDDNKFIEYVHLNYMPGQITQLVNMQKEKENNNQIANDGGSRPKP